MRPACRRSVRCSIGARGLWPGRPLVRPATDMCQRSVAYSGIRPTARDVKGGRVGGTVGFLAGGLRLPFLMIVKRDGAEVRAARIRKDLPIGLRGRTAQTWAEVRCRQALSSDTMQAWTGLVRRRLRPRGS